MKIFFDLLSIIWLARIGANVLSYTHLWFIKEYRFDRMWIHLHTAQGKRLWFIPWRLPHLSPKSSILVFTNLVVLTLLLLYLPVNWWWRLAAVDLAVFPLTAGVVLLLKLPTLIYHQILLWLAVGKLRSHQPMKVIGITGSYGKTSTKEYLTSILRSRFRVLSTEASKNSLIAIAEVVLQKLRPEHEVFVVEMGAYKRGEIAKMSAMVKPQIGVITAINAQHQDLFGSLETTKLAKYELISGLTGDKIAIFNADNIYTQELALWAKGDGKKVWLYSQSSASSGLENDQRFVATDIKSDLRSLQFKVRLDKETSLVRAMVVGEHQVSNILAATAVAVACGMKLSAAATAASKIRPLPKVLEIIETLTGIRLINDTFNNNPDAAKAALAVLAKTEGKKFLVFQPMIELGKYAESAHEEVGAYAARVCDEVILTNSNFKESFIRGVRQVAPQKKVQVLTAAAAADFLNRRAARADTVLFKGKEAEPILRRLLS